MTPRWKRHLTKVLERERDVDAVVVFTVPMATSGGSPPTSASASACPVIFYDGDVPMSLPEFGGMDTGFNYYHGADPSEYDLVVSNSEGGLPRLLELGARRAEAVFWGADAEFFAPRAVEKVHDVFFYGYGDKFRREWMAALVGEPSRAAPELEFALGGRDFQGDTGRAWSLGDVSFNTFARTISQARINLNITRRSHATVNASSTCRPFELAASGAAIVSNPHEGMERWFEPGQELLVVENADEALAAYRELLADPAQAEAMGARARERVLDEHTYARRAQQLLDLVGAGTTGRGTCLTPAGSRSSRRGTRRTRSARSSPRSAPSTPASTCSWSTTAPPTAPPSALPRPAPPSSGCRSTSGSAARSRPASCTRSPTGTSSRCASTATASTTPRSCRS